MLNLGVIGLGPTWETLYRPALARMERRTRVRAVYDAVFDRAAQVAADIDAAPIDSLRLLLQRSDVRAVVVIDPGWQEHMPARFACEFQRPVLLSGAVPEEFESLEDLRRRAEERELLIMPELRFRLLPSSLRLKELSATRLGAVERIELETAAQGDEDFRRVTMQAIDWCCHFVQSAPVAIVDRTSPTDESAGIRRLEIEFRRRTAEGAPVVSQIAVTRQGGSLPAPNPGAPAGFQCRVVCQRGSAELVDACRIAWGPGDERKSELLTSERSATELALDHFIRRILGGLIPVPTLADVSRAWRILHQADESRHRGGPAAIPPAIQG